METIYIDGACEYISDQSRVGVGVYFGEDDPRNYSGKLEGDNQSKNRGQIMASIIALERANKRNDIKIISDAQYLTKSMNQWIRKWEANGWKRKDGKNVLNKSLFKKLRSLEKEIWAHDKNVIWEWQKRDINIHESTHAHELARKGIMMWYDDSTILADRFKEEDDQVRCNIISSIPGQLDIYVDGSCKMIDGKEKAGVGIYFGEDDPRNYSGKLEGELQTNNRAEIMACIIALGRMNEQSNIRILSDSRYVVDSMNEWIRKWEANGWKSSKKHSVLNKDLWMRLATLERKIINNGYKVVWKWVKAHSGIIGNEAADRLANKGANLWHHEPMSTKKRKRENDQDLLTRKKDTIPIDPKSNLLFYFERK